MNTEKRQAQDEPFVAKQHCYVCIRSNWSADAQRAHHLSNEKDAKQDMMSCILYHMDLDPLCGQTSICLITYVYILLINPSMRLVLLFQTWIVPGLRQASRTVPLGLICASLAGEIQQAPASKFVQCKKGSSGQGAGKKGEF